MLLYALSLLVSPQQFPLRPHMAATDTVPRDVHVAITEAFSIHNAEVTVANNKLLDAVVHIMLAN